MPWFSWHWACNNFPRSPSGFEAIFASCAFFSWELGGGTRFCILLGFWLLAKAILGLRRPPVSDTGTPVSDTGTPVSDTDTPVSDMETVVSVTMVPFPKRR